MPQLTKVSDRITRTIYDIIELEELEGPADSLARAHTCLFEFQQQVDDKRVLSSILFMKNG